MTVVPVRGGLVDLARRVIERGGETFSLTSQEAALLAYLVERPNQLVETDELLREVWGHQRLVVTRAVHNTVYRLRKKIEVDPASPRHLFTEHGVGFRFVPTPVTTPRAQPKTASALVEPPDSFFGRTSELDLLETWHARGVRLQTITGPGGVGKTRLALRYRNSLRSEFVAIDASECTQASHLAAAVRQALGLGGMGEKELGVQLDASGPHKLFLDNLEQVAAAAAPVLADWLNRASELRILVTSRVPLALRGERVLQLEPLPIPTDARELLLDRTQMDARDLSPDDEAHLDGIIKTLDGVPLALEIAASRLRVVTLSELRERLHTCLLEMKRHERDVSPRHRSLRAALATSWAMLEPELAQAMADVSIFRGVFSADMAVRIVGPHMRDLLEQLWVQSLVQRRTVGGTTHYSMYVSVRSFAANRLAERPESHRQGLAERHAHTFASMSPLEDLHRISEKHEVSYLQNYAEAFEWALMARELSLATQVLRGYSAALLGELRREEAADATRRLWDAPGCTDALRARSLAVPGRFFLLDRLRPELPMLERMLEACAGEPDRVKLHVLAAKAQLLWRMGRLEEALAVTEAAEALDDDRGHKTFVATYLRGHILGALGRFDEASRALDRVLALDIPYASYAVSARLGRAVVAWVQEDLRTVAHHLDAAAAECERACFPHAGLFILRSQLEEATSRPAASRQSLKQAIALTQRRGVHHNTLLAMVSMIGLERRTGHVDAAADWAEKAVAMAREHGMITGASFALAVMGLQLRVGRPLEVFEAAVQGLPPTAAVAPMAEVVRAYVAKPSPALLDQIVAAHPERPVFALVDTLGCAAWCALEHGDEALAAQALAAANALSCEHAGVRRAHQELQGALSRGVA
ncbi:MAG: winged helix-turn-helix domain-containing protein [Myxococcota bacterium]